jgi:hypothetical protein
MHLHVALPGLLWPRDSLASVIQHLPHPALATLLGRGSVRPLDPVDLLLWLAREFESGEGEIPWGALRLLGEGGDPADAAWICADPAHLRFARDTLVLAGSNEVEVDTQEAADLVATLNRHFPDLGQFQAVSPRRWYLRLAQPPAITTRAFDLAVGRKVDNFLPEGADARAWRRVINEVQMLLHAHPVNQVREARGQAAINSLWFWGAGRLPQPRSRYAMLAADLPAARGLGLACGVRSEPLAHSTAGLLAWQGSGHALLLLDALHLPCLHLDADAWRDALEALEAEWLAPLLAALYAGQIESLRLIALGDEAAAEVELLAADRWKFWRRPTSLDRFPAA